MCCNGKKGVVLVVETRSILEWISSFCPAGWPLLLSRPLGFGDSAPQSGVGVCGSRCESILKCTRMLVFDGLESGFLEKFRI